MTSRRKDTKMARCKDPQKRVACFKPLGDSASRKSQYTLAEIYYNGGDGVRQNNAEAMKWCRRSAEQGHADSQFLLGVIYAEVPDVQAVTWYRRAAVQGHAAAQYMLGMIYAWGTNKVPQDHILSCMWYKIAALNGSDQADEWRVERESLMSAADISRAKSMAETCINSGYTECGT